MTPKDNQIVVQGISSGTVTADPQSLEVSRGLQSATNQPNADYQPDLSKGNGLIMLSGCQSDCSQSVAINTSPANKTHFSVDWGFGLLIVGAVLVVVFAKRVLSS